MAINELEWRKVADISEIPKGGAKSVELDEGRTIALFNDAGKIHATDNQYPHMGYPLTRGVIRHGILTCDWHGRSFDLEAGGCLNVECDDLQTFPVQVRNGEIWIKVGDFTYKRKDEHLESMKSVGRRVNTSMPGYLAIGFCQILDSEFLEMIMAGTS